VVLRKQDIGLKTQDIADARVPHRRVVLARHHAVGAQHAVVVAVAQVFVHDARGADAREVAVPVLRRQKPATSLSGQDATSSARAATPPSRVTRAALIRSFDPGLSLSHSS
jgi:hypothetical protein